MKRIDLIRHLERHGCEVHRQGGNHAVYINRNAKRSSAVPRHREVNDFLARKICDDLQIPIGCPSVRRTCILISAFPGVAPQRLRQITPYDTATARLAGPSETRIEASRAAAINTLAAA